MADIIITIILAIPAAVGIGVGVELGKDIYAWMKKRIKENREKISLKRLGNYIHYD